MARKRPLFAKAVVVKCAPAPCVNATSSYSMVVVPTPAPVGPKVSSMPVLQGHTSLPVTTAEPVMAKPTVNPYAAFIEAMQVAQERDIRAIQEMAEHRQANQAVIRSMQAADANTIAAFEKLIRQMKEDPANGPATPAPAAPPVVNSVPVVPAPPLLDSSSTPLGSLPVPIPAPVKLGTTSPSPKELQALVQELEQLSQKVKELSTQVQAPGGN